MSVQTTNKVWHVEADSGEYCILGHIHYSWSGRPHHSLWSTCVYDLSHLQCLYTWELASASDRNIALDSCVLVKCLPVLDTTVDLLQLCPGAFLKSTEALCGLIQIWKASWRCLISTRFQAPLAQWPGSVTSLPGHWVSVTVGASLAQNITTHHYCAFLIPSLPQSWVPENIVVNSYQFLLFICCFLLYITYADVLTKHCHKKDVLTFVQMYWQNTATKKAILTWLYIVLSKLFVCGFSNAQKPRCTSVKHSTKIILLLPCNHIKIAALQCFIYVCIDNWRYGGWGEMQVYQTVHVPISVKFSKSNRREWKCRTYFPNIIENLLIPWVQLSAFLVKCAWGIPGIFGVQALPTSLWLPRWVSTSRASILYKMIVEHLPESLCNILGPGESSGQFCSLAFLAFYFIFFDMLAFCTSNWFWKMKVTKMERLRAARKRRPSGHTVAARRRRMKQASTITNHNTGTYLILDG